MRHRLEAFVAQAPRGGDHVLDLGAVDMGDVDARAGGQQRAEILDLLGGARHHLDRVILDQRRDGAMGGAMAGTRPARLAEGQKGHEDLPECGQVRPGSKCSRAAGANPSASISVFSASASKVASRRAASALAMSEGSPSSLAHLHPAPFAQVGVLVLGADAHGDAVDGLLETFGQGRLRATTALAHDDLGGDVPPVDMRHDRHRDLQCTRPGRAAFGAP
jgi:hypothetical protein